MMNRLPAVIAILCSVLAGSGAFAVESGHSLSAKRQMASDIISCMRKRMAADKYVSYNQAAKTCKDQVAKQDEASETGPLVAADTKR